MSVKFPLAAGLERCDKSVVTPDLIRGPPTFRRPPRRRWTPGRARGDDSGFAQGALKACRRRSEAVVAREAVRRHSPGGAARGAPGVEVGLGPPPAALAAH